MVVPLKLFASIRVIRGQKFRHYFESRTSSFRPLN